MQEIRAPPTSGSSATPRSTEANGWPCTRESSWRQARALKKPVVPFGTKTRWIPSFTSLSEDPLLYERGHLAFATGLSRYLDSEGGETVSEARIVIRVVSSPDSEPFLAVMDTAAPW